MKLVFIVLCLIFGACFSLEDWKSITTADQLKNVPADNFKTIKAQDIALLLKNKKICQGFQPAQLNATPSTEFSTFTADCVANFDPATCNLGDANTNVWMFFPIAVFAGVSKDCVSHMPEKTFSKVKGKSIGQIFSPKGCGGFDSYAILSDDMYRGFSKDCAANLTWDSCYGMNSKQFALFSIEAFGGFSGDCISGYYEHKNSLEYVSKEQIAALNDKACTEMARKRSFLQSMTYEGVSGLTVDCVQSWDHDGMANLDQEQFRRLSKAVIKSFDATDISDMDDWILNSATADNMSNLSYLACRGISEEQMDKLSIVGYKGLTKMCVNNFNAVACSGIDKWGLQGIVPAVFGGITKECLSNIPSVQEMSSEQLSNLDNTCSGFSEAQFKSIPSQVFLTGMNGVCLSYLPKFTFGLMSSLNFTHVETLEGLHVDGMLSLKCNVFSTLTGPAIGKLSSEVVKALPACGIQQIPSKSYGGFLPNQVKVLNGKVQCPLISAEQFEQFTVDALHALPDTCIGNLNTKVVFNDITADRVAAFHDDQCAAFGKGFFDSMAFQQIVAFNGFSKNCISNFSSIACSDLNIDLLHTLTDTSKLNSFQPNCVAQWPVEMIKHLTIDDVNGLTKGLVGFCPDDSALNMLTLIRALPDLPLKLSEAASDNLAGGKCWNALNNLMGEGILKPSIHDSEFITTNLGLFFADDALGHKVFKKMTKNQLIGLREGHAIHFTNAEVASITNEYASELSSNFYLGINDQRITSLSVDYLTGIAHIFKYVSVGSMQYLNDAQLDKMDSLDDEVYFCYEQSLSFTEDQLKTRVSLADRLKSLKTVSTACPEYHYVLPGEEHSSHKGSKHPSHDGSGTPIWVVILVSLVSLLIGGAITFFVMQKRSSSSKPAAIGDFDFGNSDGKYYADVGMPL